MPIPLSFNIHPGAMVVAQQRHTRAAHLFGNGAPEEIAAREVQRGVAARGAQRRSREARSGLESDISTQALHGAPVAQVGTQVLLGEIPPGVDISDGVTEDEAVAVALWNNAAYQEFCSNQLERSSALRSYVRLWLVNAHRAAEINRPNQTQTLEGVFAFSVRPSPIPPVVSVFPAVLCVLL